MASEVEFDVQLDSGAHSWDGNNTEKIFRLSYHVNTQHVLVFDLHYVDALERQRTVTFSYNPLKDELLIV